MQSNNAEDEHQGKNKNNDGIDLETGALVRVQPCCRMSARDCLLYPLQHLGTRRRTQHRAAASARASTARARRPRVGNLLLLIRRRAPPNHRPGAAGRRGRRGSDARRGTRGGGSSRGRLQKFAQDIVSFTFPIVQPRWETRGPKQQTERASLPFLKSRELEGTNEVEGM